MRDWQHELRNRLNLVLYLTHSARESLLQERGDDVLRGLARIENAIAECGGLLEHAGIAHRDVIEPPTDASPPPATPMPDPPEAGQAR